MGGALSASTIAGVMGGCRPGPATEPFVPQTISAAQNDLVTTITELIIPETDTPGAKAARVNEFIDKMLTDWFKDDEREHFMAELATVDAQAQDAYGKPFLDLTPEQQNERLAAMEEEGLAWTEALGGGGADPEKLPFFNLIKQLTLAGYYTSEIGGSQELRDMPIGQYRGDVPFDEIGRAWS